MEKDEILEEKKEGTTENDETKNEPADNPSALAAVTQKPVEGDGGGGNSNAEDEEEDPGMGSVIENMLRKPRVRDNGPDPGMGSVIENMLTNPVAEDKPMEREKPKTEDNEPEFGTGHVIENMLRKPRVRDNEPDPGMGSAIQNMFDSQKADSAPAENTEGSPAVQNLENRNADNGALDMVREDMLEAYRESGGGGSEGGGEQNGAFDTLQELKNLRDKQPDEKAGKNENNDNNHEQNDVGNVIKKIAEARRGNIYAAVVLAKGLENNESNPFTSGGYKRRSRFMNSSGLNKALEINKMAGGVHGILSTVIPNYGKSKVASAVTLVTNMIAVVGSTRDLMKKIRMYRNLPKTNSPGMDGKMKKNVVRTKVFTVLGMISDAVMILNKLCGIAKTIAGFWNPKSNPTAGGFAKVAGYVSLALGGATQIMGLASNVNQMLKIKEDIQEAEDAKEEKGKEVDAIWDKYLPATRAGTKEAKEKLKAKKQQAAENTDGGQERPQEEEDPDSDENLYTGSRSYIALRLLKRADVSEEEKDTLSEYLRLVRKVGRLDSQFRDGVYGLVTLSTGLMATITGSVKAGLDTSGMENATDKQKKDANISANVNSAMGVVSNSMVLVNSARGFAKGWGKDPDEQGDMLKARARGVVDGLKDEKYGLKGIEASFLVNPQAQNENIENAQNILNKYAAADKSLKSLGVKYPALLKAANVKEFDAALIADI